MRGKITMQTGWRTLPRFLRMAFFASAERFRRRPLRVSNSLCRLELQKYLKSFADDLTVARVVVNNWTK